MELISKLLIKSEYQKLTPHPLLAKLGLTIDKESKDAFEFFASEAKHFKHYDRLLITEGNLIIGNLAAWHAASTNEQEELQADVLKDFEDDDLLRFINAKSIFFRRSVIARSKLFATLKDHLKNTPKGIDWALSLKGDINDQIALITGYSVSTIKLVMAIDRENPALLLDVEEGKVALRKAYESCKISELVEKAKDVVADVIKQVAPPKPVLPKFSRDNFKPTFANNKPSIQVFGKSIPLVEKEVIEKPNSITYIYTNELADAGIEIKFTNLKKLQAIS